MRPMIPVSRAETGSAPQKGQPSLAVRTAEIYPPTAINPACPKDICPQ